MMEAPVKSKWKLCNYVVGMETAGQSAALRTFILVEGFKVAF